MPSQVLEALERAVPLTQAPLSLGLGDASVRFARPLRQLLEMFTDHRLEGRLPEALPTLGAPVMLNGQTLTVSGYRLQRHAASVQLHLLVPSPLDPTGASVLAISLCNDMLSLPSADDCAYRAPSACASMLMCMYDIIEAAYPQQSLTVGYTRRAMSQFTAMVNALPKVGRRFELYLASDGLHLRQDGDYRGQWLLPPPPDRWTHHHPTR